jgi:hypothetical protein
MDGQQAQQDVQLQRMEGSPHEPATAAAGVSSAATAPAAPPPVPAAAPPAAATPDAQLHCKTSAPAADAPADAGACPARRRMQPERTRARSLQRTAQRTTPKNA